MIKGLGKMKYLIIIICVLVLCLIVLALFLIKYVKLYGSEKISNKKLLQLADKHFMMFLTIRTWKELDDEGVRVSDYFITRGYKRICVYGMGLLGETFVKEAQKGNIGIIGYTDRSVDKDVYGVKKIDLSSVKDFDVILVTAVSCIDEIEDELSQVMSCPILSLYEVLNELKYEKI